MLFFVVDCVQGQARNGNEWPDNLLQPQGHDNNDPPHDASMSCKLLHSLFFHILLHRAARARLSCCIEQPAHFSLVASSSLHTSLLLHRATRALLSCCIEQAACALLSCCIEQPAHFSLVASSSGLLSCCIAACALLSCCIEQPAHFSLVASSSLRTSLLLQQPAHFSLVASSNQRTSLLLHRRSPRTSLLLHRSSPRTSLLLHRSSLHTSLLGVMVISLFGNHFLQNLIACSTCEGKCKVTVRKLVPNHMVQQQSTKFKHKYTLVTDLSQCTRLCQRLHAQSF